MQETQVQSLSLEGSLEEEMATHSSVLAWKIPRPEESDELQSMGLQKVRHDWVCTHRQLSRLIAKMVEAPAGLSAAMGLPIEIL